MMYLTYTYVVMECCMSDPFKWDTLLILSRLS